MNPSTQPNNQHQQDRALLDDFQRELVIEMRKRLKTGDLDNNDLCKFADRCVDFQKQANDREKTALTRERLTLSRDRLVAYERRTDASYHLAQGRNDTQLEIARLRAEAASAKRRPDHPQVDKDDPAAPYGRKNDGTPYTHEEFKQSLDQAIKEIWGLPPMNPKSQMPKGWKASPDRMDAGARSPSDAPEGEPAPRDDFAIRQEFTRRGRPFAIQAVSPTASSNPKETAPGRDPSGDG